MSKDFITLEHITKSFDSQMVLDDLNLTIKENEFMTLLGPSRRGKTTTLRLIGGFETLTLEKSILTVRILLHLHQTKEN